jgi:Tfp pilus assembly protein PilX
MRETIRRRSDEGAALMVSLGLLAILAMLGGAFVTFMHIEQSSAEYDLDALRARYLARGAIEVARLRIETLEDPSGELTGELQGGTYTVNVREAKGAYEADATGRFIRRNGSVVTARIFSRFRPTEAGVGIETWHE